MVGKIQLIAFVATCAAFVGCSRAMPTQLGTCWNINEAKVGPVSGTGIFVNSHMHGLALVSPDCDDRAGSNRYELDANASLELSKADGSPKIHQADFLRFQFEGNVKSDSRGKTLTIGKIWAIWPTSEPNWQTMIRRKHRN